MSFQLIFSEDARLQLVRLDNELAERIILKIQKTNFDPSKFFERLAGREEYKLRAGDYRIIARILPNENIIFIQSIGHRKNIYKKP